MGPCGLILGPLLGLQIGQNGAKMFQNVCFRLFSEKIANGLSWNLVYKIVAATFWRCVKDKL